MPFKNDFVWGAATASFQIEGATQEGGRGPSVWDMLCAKPGAVFEGHTGDPACDHYHRYPEDVALMKAIGLKGYRFSIAWPRVMPTGTGAINKEGLDFYDRLVDELLKAGIQPYATLYHWDTPLDVYRRGGWLNRDIASWFADYSAVVTKRLGDRVTSWMTQNEPQVYVGLGMLDGIHAPGDKLEWSQVLLAIHNSNLAHGMSVQAIRANSASKPSVGVAPAVGVFMPSSDSPADVEAARQASFSVKSKSTWNTAWWLDPILKGVYPEEGVEFYGKDMPDFPAEDLKTMCQPLDFLGMNIYHGRHVKAGPEGFLHEPQVAGRPITALKWPVTPDCLYWGPKFHYERYGLPITITENGLSSHDWVMLDGKVHDSARVDFLNQYLLELERAADDGVPVNGYFQWSLLDNFEWAEGYKERFGLIHVDYATQKRTPKDSYYWYGEVIRTNGASLHALTRV